jgi:hypothetical protein
MNRSQDQCQEQSKDCYETYQTACGWFKNVSLFISVLSPKMDAISFGQSFGK